jgi:hypothetical protein
VAGKNSRGEGERSPAHVVTRILCPGDEGAVPDDAGNISGAESNECPVRTVELSVAPIAGATSYSWNITHADNSVETIVTVLPAYGAGQSGSYTVAGKNSVGEGKRSAVHTVTYTPCPGDEGAVPGDAGNISGADGNVCPVRTVELSVAPIAGATSYSWHIACSDNEVEAVLTVQPMYLANRSGSYTVAGRNEQGEGKRSAAHVFTKSACPGEEGAVPDAAGSISGSNMNICPSWDVSLSVAPIVGATSYSWYIAYAPDDIDRVRTTSPNYTANLTTLVEGQSVTYTVAGVNAVGEGAASPQHVLTKQLCPPEKPVIAGISAWRVADEPGFAAVYKIQCPARSMSGTATSTSPNVAYRWYQQLVGSDSELQLWSGATDPFRNLGTAGEIVYDYNYAVVAVNADGESPMSDVIKVKGAFCCEADKPGGANGNVAVFPFASGFYPPDGGPYNISLSNCDVYAKTGDLLPYVELYCNAANAPGSPHPTTGYAFWVKTTSNGSFVKVYDSPGTTSANRRLKVDGSPSYPAGTYAVTARNECGESPFGNNYVIVTGIYTSCPSGVAPRASVMETKAGDTKTAEVQSNNGTPEAHNVPQSPTTTGEAQNDFYEAHTVPEAPLEADGNAIHTAISPPSTDDTQEATATVVQHHCRERDVAHLRKENARGCYDETKVRM